METIRPEVLAFVQAAKVPLSRVTEQRPLSDEEAGEIAQYMEQVEDQLDQDSE